ncbi:helix-turn-helix domain-containing protein [Pseudonocardia petroleophila]
MASDLDDHCCTGGPDEIPRGDPRGANEEARVMPDLKKGARITGTQRDKLAGDLKKKYEKGASIRALAESTGRSYGFVHRVLSETGVTLRGRGGATRTKKK